MEKSQFTLEDEVTPQVDNESIGSRIRGAFSRDKSPKEKPVRERMPRGHPNKDEIGELVSLVNLPIAMLSPRDAFTPLEVQRLSDALDTYAQTSETARRFMYSIIRRSALLALVNVAGMIALPRLIRHGILPASIAPYLTGVCDASQLADAVNMQPQPDGSWSFDGSQNGNRPADVPPIYAEA